MRTLALLGLLAAAACGGSSTKGVAPGGPTGPTSEQLAAVVAVERAGCARCHSAAPLPAGLLRDGRGPAMATAAGWWQTGLAAHLRNHHGGEAATDLAAWVRSLGDSATTAPAEVSPSLLARGEQLFGALACGTCHAPAAIAALGERTDFAHVRAFLRDPAAHRPGALHDFAIDDDEADALAVWLLRGQQQGASAPLPGFAFECFELHIGDARMPSLDGLQPTARGVVQKLDVEPRTREDHFVLRFSATLDVPATGEWTFTVGSDDSSWLSIDGKQVVRNEALAPYRRRSGKVALTAGPHDLQVVFTEAGGGQQLDVLWRGPDFAEQELTAAHASAQRTVLTPPPAAAAPAAEAVQRGRLAAAQKRCVSCHQIDDPELASLPAPAAARPFAELGEQPCPAAHGAAALVEGRRAVVGAPLPVAQQLQVAMLADGCLSCHQRDGRGGLPPAVRQHLVEVEDIGDEGRLPPDLTDVGHRLRGGWIERLLSGEVRARPYLQVRMPKLSAERARQYAAWFAAVDGRDGDDVEPVFSAETIELGRRMAGVGGRNCVTCHTFAGRRSLGPQGMDLVMQHQRLRPAWFRQWVLAPTRHRPGTRMPPAWLDDGPQACAEVDAIRVLTSLGDAAPLPPGVDQATGLVLVPAERPILHGAFLKGLSARCIAVGSPLRTHYAFDVEHAALAWLWRGDFVDAKGTWSGRAGELLEPLGKDHVVLTDFVTAPAGERRVLGRRQAQDGYPVFRVGIGEGDAAIEYEDHSAPRLREGGSEIVRTLRGVRGAIEFTFTADRTDGAQVLIEGQPAALLKLRAGQQVEVVYRW